MRKRNALLSCGSGFVRFSKKATVGDFVESEDGFFLTEFFSNQAYHAPVVCLGSDPDQPNGRLCLRLDVAPEELAVMTDEALQTYLSAKPGSPSAGLGSMPRLR